MKAAALEAGALGCSLSGSGPSIFALAASLDLARAAGAAMQRAFDAASNWMRRRICGLPRRHGKGARDRDSCHRMICVSTRGKAPAVSLREAVLAGIAPDGGLYVPSRIDRLPDAWWQRQRGRIVPGVAVALAAELAGDEFDRDALVVADSRRAEFSRSDREA